jgi:diglucosylglycerate octanoyltransferase
VSRGAGCARHDFRILLLGDSLSFQGPQGIVSPADPQLYPNVMAEQLSLTLGQPVSITGAAREGWTARDAWWALTKDPHIFAEELPVTDALFIGVGGMDQLPTVMPTFLRDSIPYLRPGGLRRKVRRVYRSAAPRAVAMTGGLLRQLPQSATDRYLTRIVQAVRMLRGNIPILAITPSPYGGTAYPSQKFHAAARRAMLSWGINHQVAILDIEEIVNRQATAGDRNPDGMHWGWSTHQEVGTALARLMNQEIASVGLPAHRFIENMDI